MMNSQKQKLLIEYLISSTDTFTLAKSIVDPMYFDPSLRKVVTFLHNYYDKYNALPDTTQIHIETGQKLSTHTITRDKIKYCSEEIEQYCRRRALQTAVVSAPALIDNDDYAQVEISIKEALAVGLHRKIGIDYFKDPLSRIESTSQQAARISTLWTRFDELVGGGVARGELILFSANSGGGKSITLANLGINFVTQGLNVLYITLELSEALIAQRFDTMFTGVPSILWQQNHNEIGGALIEMGPSMGRLVIKHMKSGSTTNDIRSFLKEYELTYNEVPDLLIVDYIDIMGANTFVPVSDVWAKDKIVSEQLRDVGGDYDMVVATASQQTRGAIDADQLTQGHIAGGITKVNTCDVYVSIVLSPTMKAAGELGFTFLKTRNSDGVGKTAMMRWVNKSLRIYNATKDEDIDDDGVILARVADSKIRKKKVGFDDLLNMT